MVPMAASLIAPMIFSLIQTLASSLINAINGKGQEGGFLPLLALPLIIKAMSQGLEEDIITWVNIFSPAHPLSNIEITKYLNYEPRFNGVFSRDKLPRIKDEAYVIIPNHKQSKLAHQISLFIDRNTAVYFDSFGIEYTPQEVLRKIKDNSTTHNIFRIQDDDSFMCRFYCIAFIECMSAGKTLLVIPKYFLLMTIKK